ncbi:MAG TPA: hypothetical protein PL037_03795 [Elusimicrobiales bacterium]|nr:hypothetical protein [Elusimicrobiales bacterium]
MSTTETKMRESELLDKLICDYGPSKYLDIVWAMEWARCLRGREEFRQLTMAEMIEKAMLDVVSGQAGSETILASIYGSSPAAKPEAAAEDKKEEKKAAKAEKTEKKAEKSEKKADDKEESKKAKKEKAKKD